MPELIFEKENLRIEKASLQDTPLLETLEQECFEEDCWKKEQLENEFTQNPFSECWILYEKDQPAGYLIFWKIFEQASIVRIGILRKSRKNGLASLLMRALISIMKEKEAEQINLEVRSSNAAAIALYEKHGFQSIQKIPKYYENGEDGLRMISILI